MKLENSSAQVSSGALAAPAQKVNNEDDDLMARLKNL